MKKNIIRIISLCLCIFISMGVLSSCDILFGNQTPPDNNQAGGGSNPLKPPSTGGSGNNDDEKEETYSEKGVFFSSNAEEGGDGTIEKPFNSLEDISSVEFVPGTHIYIEKGSKFLGSLVLNGVQGSDEEPVVVTSYGKGKTPIIDGNDHSGGGVLYLANCSNILVKNLEITDSAKEEADRRGVLITCDNNAGTEDVITYKNIKLEKLYIHDIVGFRDAANSGMALTSKITGGIQVWSNDGLGRIDGLEIADCRIKEVSNVGVSTWYQIVRNEDGTISAPKVSPYSGKFKDYAYLNVNIHDNDISFIGKNAIFVRNLYKGFIEKNVVHDTAIYCVSGNTIVTSYVDSTIIQYNEGYRNMARTNENTDKLQDGCMLDADLASKDTIWQYNYSHDNSFGLFINCTYNTDQNGRDKVIVRYNLSVNDKGNKGIIYINFDTAGVYVYNNTIITGYDTKCIIQSNSNRTSYFYNNLIYNRSSNAKFDVPSNSGMTAESNLVYSEPGSSIADMEYFKGINTNGVYENPIFMCGEYINEDATPGIGAQSGFMVDAKSPALKGGKEMEAVADFFGNEYKKSIGFHCGE